MWRVTNRLIHAGGPGSKDRHNNSPSLCKLDQIFKQGNICAHAGECRKKKGGGGRGHNANMPTHQEANAILVPLTLLSAMSRRQQETGKLVSLRQPPCQELCGHPEASTRHPARLARHWPPNPAPHCCSSALGRPPLESPLSLQLHQLPSTEIPGMHVHTCQAERLVLSYANGNLAGLLRRISQDSTANTRLRAGLNSWTWLPAPTGQCIIRTFQIFAKS